MNQFNSENRTPLHLATINGHGNIVNLLLSHKANPYLRDKNNYSSYQYAIMKRLHFCLLIYERYNVGKEKQQNEKHSLNENLINELTTFRPINPQFSHYQDFNLNTCQDSDSQTKSPPSSIPETRSVVPVNNKQISQSTKQAHNSSSSLNDSIRKKITNNLSIESNNDNNIVNKDIHPTLNHVSPRMSFKMVVGGSQQETLNPGFVLLGTRQQGVPVILRELVLPSGFDLVSPSFTDQLTEIKSIINNEDYKMKNNFTIKHKLLPTDKRVNRINNHSKVSSKRINQQIDKIQNSTVKLRNHIQSSLSSSSSSDHSDIDSKRNNESNECLIPRRYNNHSINNNGNVINATYNNNKINSKDVDKLKNSDSSSVSDINSVLDNEKILMSTPRKISCPNEINQNSLKSGLYHPRLLKRGQVNNMPQEKSM
ncbi:unnamed protein product [Schistosoma margrebowiei]|uniref:Uncharacterized protein n=1 Tax=Schistosoma margrebowiei TaxID=48269 RepID=A0A3P7ZVB4_9TREM|nr:unnamed protein product [Schistosoma margrebowiei]